jgi:hypothetical protein
MRIETLADWNLILAGCGCCEMPGCPEPDRECESIQAQVSSQGHFNLSDSEWTLYSKYVFSSSFSESFNDGFTSYSASSNQTTIQEWSRPFQGSVNSGINGCKAFTSVALDSCITSGSATRTYRATQGGPVEFVETTNRTQLSGNVPGDPCQWVDVIVYDPTDENEPSTEREEYNTSHLTVYPLMGGDTTFEHLYDNPLTYEGWIELVSGLLEDEMQDFDTCKSGSACSSALNVSPKPASTGGGISMTAIKSRFRWVIPQNFEGSYFKIGWDVLEEPDGWDSGDPDAPSRFYSAANQAWVWAGPGDPEDPDSWKSPWFEIAAPSVPGTRRVVNIPYECYRSTKFGTRPQVTGEGVDDVPVPDPGMSLVMPAHGVFLVNGDGEPIQIPTP